MKFENMIIDKVAALAPWLAPFIPAYFAAYNAYDYLIKGRQWWDWIAVIIIALAVETIGIAGVHTALQFWTWNKYKNKSDNPAPLGLAVAAVLSYVVIIITVNASLDLARVSNPAALPYIEIFAIGLLSLLALNSALIVALRYGQSWREREKVERKEERKVNRKLTGNLPETSVSFDDFRQVPKTEYSYIAGASTSDICSRYGVTERTARNWRKSAQGKK